MGSEFRYYNDRHYMTRPMPILVLVLALLLSAFLIGTKGMLAGFVLIAAPIAFVFLVIVFVKPEFCFLTAFVMNFMALGISRYVPSVPWGLTIDSLLILTYVALFFKSFNAIVPWHKAKTLLTLVAAFWFGMALMQLVNPETASRAAWFYAMRGIALYMFLVIPLVSIMFDQHKHLMWLLYIWAFFTFFASLEGIRQKTMGLNGAELRWLAAGAAKTHILFGQLRIFSFMADAGIFGGSQGQAGVVFIILALGEKKNMIRKVLFGIVGALAIYGMMLSGTRGSIVIPLAGFALYVVLQKNVVVLGTGGLILAMVFVFFKFTTIGNSNYTILRMRTAFDSNDASLNVRLDNQRILRGYMKSRPFGGGIGSTGGFGKRFSPGTFLAEMPPDSWYVIIWVEQGVIGLTIHLMILFYVMGTACYNIYFRLTHPVIINHISAITCGMFGVMAASYVGEILGQMPVGLTIYMGMVYMFISPKLEKELIEKEEQERLESQRKLDLPFHLKPRPI